MLITWLYYSTVADTNFLSIKILLIQFYWYINYDNYLFVSEDDKLYISLLKKLNFAVLVCCAATNQGI